MTHKKHVPTALIILDGFGFRTNTEGNAIALADIPHIAQWMKTYPHTLLKASGGAVGLPEDTIGNSEVGHTAIGCGRIIEQPLTSINNAIADGSFFTHPVLQQEFARLKNSGKTLHIMGLLSNAGVHSSIDHIYAYIQAAVANGVQHIVAHAFLDGRDSSPKSAAQFLEPLEQKLQQSGKGIIGSIHGRLYAMDRDHHWDRTEKSYRVLTQHNNAHTQSWQDIVQKNYTEGITDEFIEPIQLTPRGAIDDGDGIIFANIRPDRARQLTASFTHSSFKHFKTEPLKLSFFITPIAYTKEDSIQVLYPQTTPSHTLKDVLAAHDKTMLSIAETEKYAHVTYFFSGGNEKIVHNEIRILIPSIKAISYAQIPAMSAQLITHAVIKSLNRFPRDFYLINYANADMVGHSGNLNATIKAVETLDAELAKLYAAIVEQRGGTIYITADHGKAEQMIDGKTGLARTAHTTNPVPFVMIRKGLEGTEKRLSLKGLADIAPFILENMGVEVPSEMSSKRG